MSPSDWGDATWPVVQAATAGRLVALLPVGAVEAHGPHLPLRTDGVIAGVMAAAAAERLHAEGLRSLILPTIEYTAAPFAAGFSGTIGVRAATITALVVDIGRSLAAQGVDCLALANAHFDPENLASLHAAVEQLRAAGEPRVAFPDVTRRPWALRLSDEFKSGACHAGRYEGSIVMAARPELVDEETRQGLAENLTSLSEAILAGKQRFEEIGGSEAYFGDPAAATAVEGHETIDVLGGILAEAVLAEMSDGDGSGQD